LRTLLFLSFICWYHQILCVDFSFHITIIFLKNITLHIKLKKLPHHLRLQTSIVYVYVAVSICLFWRLPSRGGRQNKKKNSYGLVYVPRKSEPRNIYLFPVVNREWGRLPCPFIVQGHGLLVVYMQTNRVGINIPFCCKVGINMFVRGIYFQLKQKNTCGVIFCAKTCAQ
jgi:hypothetical protein